MTGFPTRPLRELARLSSGGTPSKSNAVYWDGTIPWLTPKDMSRFDGTTQDSVTEEAIGNGTRQAPAGSIFIAVRGMSLHNEIRIVRPTVRMAFNQDVKAVSPGGSVDGQFLHYAMLARVPDLRDAVEAAGHGTGVLPTDRLSDLSIPDLSLPEQRAIAATLGALDDKIELHRRMNATLESMARALFRDWFVDFGPTRAKMEGREPYLSPDLWSLFPDRLDSDGKPEGWKAGTLANLARLNPESWSAKRAPAAVCYVDLANTKWGTIDKIEEYEWTDAPSRARRILRPGDTIVGTVRPGNGSFAHIGEDGLTGSTGFAVLRPNDPRDRGFVWCAATSPENIDRLAHLADGGAYPAVRPDAVAGTEIVIPDAPILAVFDKIGRAHLDMMEANKRESRTLAQTRDLLLPRLMSGKIRLSGTKGVV